MDADNQLPTPVSIPPPKIFDMWKNKGRGKNGVQVERNVLQGKYGELPYSIRNTKGIRGVNLEKFQQRLLKKPPAFEFVSCLEVYLLDEQGNREKRVCGGLLHSDIANFVPEGMKNPYQVTNPRDAYRCLNPPGTKTDHPGIGPCKVHRFQLPHTLDPTVNSKRRGMLPFKELVGHLSMGTQAMIKEEDAMVGARFDNFDAYVKKARELYSPEDLFDIIRPLYEIEALKLQAKEHMEATGFNEFDLKRIVDAIDQSANIQLTLAKRDETLARSNFISMTLKVVLAGIVAILDQEIDASKVVKIIERFEKDVILPLNDRGVTEVMQRQIAAGLHNRVAVEPERTPVYVEEKS